MQTVVLAAGEGTRMRPLTDRRPKPALPVGDRTLIERVLNAAVAAGATRLVVVVGYRGDQVRELVEDRAGEDREVPVDCVEQQRQRGTADAVLAARDRLERAPFAVLNGDCLYDRESLARLYDRAPAVGAVRVENPSQYGVLRTADGTGETAGETPGGDRREDPETDGPAADGPADPDSSRVTDVVEKPDDPPSDLANAGAYAFPAAALDRLAVEESERGERELTDVLAAVCADHAVRAVGFDRWLDVGRAWELLAANEWVVGDRERRIDPDAEVHEDADLRGRVVVEAGATVEAGVVVEGPALVREGASVGPNAYVRGTTLVGPDARVGHAVEVKNSVLMRGATVGHLSYVGDSILGREVNLGAGTTVANLRHDEAPVELTVRGDRVSTGRRKFGVVLGDGARTGIDVALNAGVTLSTDARVGPGETVTRDR